MRKLALNVDSRKISPKQLSLFLSELESVVEVEDGFLYYDEENEEQCRKMREIFDKHLLFNQ